MKRAFAWMGWGAAVLALLVGCGRNANAPGVAATVNGEPLTVATLEARHDLARLGLPAVANPAVERLRAEYGAILAEMIVARLAGQELARRDLAVTDAELAAAEATVRADYPGDTFAHMLLEEHIDLQRWREALRDRLTVEKFAQKVLGPNIWVNVSEAAAYYKNHMDAFTTPPRVELLLVRSGEAGPLQAALAAFAASGQRQDLTRATGVTVEALTVPEANMPKTWQAALRGVKPGGASSILSDGGGRMALVVLQRHGETVLEPAKAYAQVEALLSAEKREQAFEAWLAKALAKATIRVNTALLTTHQEDRPAAEAAAESPSAVATAAKPVAAGETVPRQEAQAVAQTAETPPAARPEDASGQAAPNEAGKPPVAPLAAAPETQVPTEKAEAAAPAAVPVATPAAADAPTGAEDPADKTTDTASPTAAAPPPADAAKAGQEVEFAAVKASWILYTADAQAQERMYLKPGKPFRVPFAKHLSVRLGSPSEVTYRFRGQEKTVEVKKKESRTLEFP